MKIEPLCVADFGKVIKSVFKNIRPRRLGQRGNSRYCYSGLRKKVNFEKPELPDLYKENNKNELPTNRLVKQDSNELNNLNSNQLEQQISIQNDKSLVLSASSHIILEWAKKMLNLNLTSIKDLAKHLILLNHIDKESMAALTVIASEDDQNEKDEFSFNNFNQLNNNSLATMNNRLDRKSLDFFKVNAKNKADNLTFKKLLASDASKKDKQVRKKLDKEQMKSIGNKKLEKGKISRVFKMKKGRIKKDQLKSLPAKIKLESFDDLTSKLTLSNSDKLIEINNKTKNQIEQNNQLIENTQLDLNSNQKRRHSTIGFEQIKAANQLDSQIVDDTNFKFQMKRQTNEHFGFNRKKRNLAKLNQQMQSNGYSNNNKIDSNSNSYFTNLINQQTTDDLNLQSTNYLLNEPTAKDFKNNQLVSYKRYFDFNQLKSSDTTQNLQLKLNNDPNSKIGLFSNGNDRQTATNLMPSVMNRNNLNQTISTQVDEQELYQFNNNNLFENGNQLISNFNTTSSVYTPKNNLMNNMNDNSLMNQYNESTTFSNMCNVNTQMPSIPPSPINHKDNLFANQFSATNQMSNNQQLAIDKIDFNNNNLQQEQQSTTINSSSIGYSPYATNEQLTNNINQKLFINPQQQQNLINKTSAIANNRTLNRVRHSSGPSHTYNSAMLYNNFLPNSSLINIRSNSLSPLYENCTASVNNLNQKMANFNSATNFNNNSTMMNKFEKSNYVCLSSPVSPVSEPMSPSFNAFLESKKQSFTSLRLNKLSSNKKDVRSASFAGSPNEPFFPAAATTTTSTRTRHMSSPLCPNNGSILPSNSNLKYENSSFSSQSLTNSPIQFITGDFFVQNNSNATNSMNLANGNNFVPLIASNNNKINYELPPSPPLSGLLNDEKKFENLKDCLIKSNEQLRPTLQQQQQSINMNIQANQTAFNQTQFNSNLNDPNLMSRSISEQPIVDDLQTTLQDLKDCDKDFSCFYK